jgi:hypothetical protein
MQQVPASVDDPTQFSSITQQDANCDQLKQLAAG